MDLLEEGDLLLQALDASLQVQPGQCGVVHILEAITVSSSEQRSDVKVDGTEQG